MSKPFFLILIIFATACETEKKSGVIEVLKTVDGPIQPIEAFENLDLRLVELGRDLFHDNSLSSDNTVSCATCHMISEGGDDALQFSFGAHKRIGEINSPTVLNSVFNFKQFWDGRAENLIDQLDGPITNPKELNTNWDEIIRKINAKSEYVNRFKQILNDGVNKTSISTAIVEFEKSLVTPSRFDRFLLGEKTAISEKELNGYHKFVEYGCVSCHQGKNVGGNMFQKFGVFENYFDLSKEIKDSDLGRYNVTGKDEDKFFFKVPSLRNVAITSPYFHDGSVQSLEEAIMIMARIQVGKELSTKDISDISAFLTSLTGEEYDVK